MQREPRLLSQPVAGSAPSLPHRATTPPACSTSRAGIGASRTACTTSAIGPAARTPAAPDPATPPRPSPPCETPPSLSFEAAVTVPSRARSTSPNIATSRSPSSNKREPNDPGHGHFRLRHHHQSASICTEPDVSRQARVPVLIRSRSASDALRDVLPRRGRIEPCREFLHSLSCVQLGLPQVRRVHLESVLRLNQSAQRLNSLCKFRMSTNRATFMFATLCKGEKMRRPCL